MRRSGLRGGGGLVWSLGAGSSPNTVYTVHAVVSGGHDAATPLSASCNCTCPVKARWQNAFCKHTVALLLWQLPAAPPPSATAAAAAAAAAAAHPPSLPPQHHTQPPHETSTQPPPEGSTQPKRRARVGSLAQPAAASATPTPTPAPTPTPTPTAVPSATPASAPAAVAPAKVRSATPASNSSSSVLPAARAVSEVTDEALVAWAEKLLLEVHPSHPAPPP